MLPVSLLRHRATITRVETTGTGTVETLVASGVPCIGEADVKTTMYPEGPVTYTQYSFHFRPNVDVRVHDTIEFQERSLTVSEVETVVGPNLQAHHLKVVAF